MCGIIGILCQKSEASEHALNALKQLQNRGYDSVGVLYFKDDGETVLEKEVSNSKPALEKLPVLQESKICMGHTRWATHGPKTVENAHPHIDMRGRVAIVHNGIIENFKELKTALISRGVSFQSETDSEVVVNLLGEKLEGGMKMLEALSSLSTEIRGTWGLVIMDLLDTSVLYCMRKGSPLLVGKSEKTVFVTSEQTGFCGNVLSYVALDDDEICTLSINEQGVTVRTMSKDWNTYEQIQPSINTDDLELSGYAHWMEKEILEQEDSVLRTLGMGGRIADSSIILGGLSACTRLVNVDHVVILGCGTSKHAAMYAKQYYLSTCEFTTVQVEDASEFVPESLPKRGRTIAILVSQSGETRDLHKCMPFLRKADIPCIGVINVVGSQIARDVDCGVYCNAGREVAVASTKSFTSQAVALVLIALWFSQRQGVHASLRHRIIQSLRKLPQDIGSVLRGWEQIEEVAFTLKEYPNCFILGKGDGFPIALEGALKIKEISGIHAEGSSASSLKHGPFGLLDSDFPVLLIKMGDTGLLESVFQEITSRGAPVIVISPNRGSDLTIPNSEYFGPLLAGVLFQMLSYRISVLKNLNPDYPKNLAKVVTTD